MIPVIQKPAITRRQKSAALKVAWVADLLQIAVFPAFFAGIISPFEDILDVLVAVILMAICGFRWQFVLAFLMELVPGLDLVPTWIAVVSLMPTHDDITTNVNVSKEEYPPLEVTAVVVPPVSKPEKVESVP